MAFLALFALFCCLSSSLLSLFPFFLVLVSVPYGWRQGRAVWGLCPPPPPNARPWWGALCLLLGLCEPVREPMGVRVCL